VWDSLVDASPLYVVPALALQTLQIVFSATAWYGILSYAYDEVSWRRVLACCATGMAVNSFVAGEVGTVVLAVMLVASIPAATPAGIVAAAAVEKVFFAVAGLSVAVYLFVSVGGTFEVEFGFVSRRPWLTALCVAAAVVVVAVVARLASRWLRTTWEEAREGGRILGNPRAYLTRVVSFQVLAWCCKLGLVAVLLTAHGIPVDIDALMRVTGGNTVAGAVSFTPGGIGVNQAFNVASLHGTANAASASAYSISQQALTSGWNVAVAVLAVAVAFGWTAGKQLVVQSFGTARETVTKRKAGTDG
jgi:uncharacterized membrane protein YbhN (UPF0104 family)